MPWVGEWLHKPWYSQTMEYYTAVKRVEQDLCEVIWSDSQDILFSENCKGQRVAIVW